MTAIYINHADSVDACLRLRYQDGIALWPGGRVVMQRPAKPCTPVRFRSGPPMTPHFPFIFAIAVAYRVFLACVSRRFAFAVEVFQQNDGNHADEA
jgi:hypothetical protein